MKNQITCSDFHSSYEKGNCVIAEACAVFFFRLPRIESKQN